MIDDLEQRSKIAEILGRVVNTISSSHMRRGTQEPAITARIGQRLEDVIQLEIEIEEVLNTLADKIGSSIYDISITVQDIPDRGPKSLEKISGIDIYINITLRTDERIISKGVIVQSKKIGSKDNLLEQCKKMSKRSRSSYVWIYTPTGTNVQDVSSIIANAGKVDMKSGRSPSDMFDRVLECIEGDLAIGLDPNVDQDVALDNMLTRLKIPHGISFELVPGV